MRCGRLAWQIPARSEAPTVLAGLSVKNKNMIITKQLFRDFESNVCSSTCFRFSAALNEVNALVKGKYEIE
jgi:hypothetical protein